MSETQEEKHTNTWNLTALRNLHGISMAKLAAAIDVTPATVWHWEHKPMSALLPKHLRMLETVFTPAEVDSLLHPEEYFDEDGNQIKPFEFDEPDQYDLDDEKDEKDDFVQEEIDQAEFARLLKELTAVFLSMDAAGKRQLVQFADFFYHNSHGMILPGVSSIKGDIDYAQIFSWPETEERR